MAFSQVYLNLPQIDLTLVDVDVGTLHLVTAPA